MSNKFEMKNMNKFKKNEAALEHLSIVSPNMLEILVDVTKAINILNKEFERESEGKDIKEDKKLQLMSLEYLKACNDAEKIFGQAIKILELTGFEFSVVV